MFHPHALQPGEVFAGDFRIERGLAMGGMGAVYVVEQLSTGRKRALKLLLPSLIANPKVRERFEQEARVSSHIQSDHVVEVVAAGVDPATGAPWLAMELLEGETLAQRVERQGPLAPFETREVFRQLCHALGAAHASGLVHRDIKPENLYLARARREGVPFTLKILDFGIAKLTADVRGAGSATSAVGTPLWMAPEQASPANVGPPADVWALGLVAFFCLTGHFYWRSATGADATLTGLLKEVMLDPLPPATVRAAELGVAQPLPAGFDAWFEHCVVREPAQRFADAQQALVGLDAVLDPRGTGPTAFAPTHMAVVAQTSASIEPAAASKSHAGRWALAGAGVLLLGGFALVVIVGGAAAFYFFASDGAAIAPPPVPAVPAPPGAPPAPPAQVGEESSKSGTTTARGKVPAVPAVPAVPNGPAVPAAPAAPTATEAQPSDPTQDPKNYPPRNYNIVSYNSKIKQCWKGNEGAKPDAGTYSPTISVKLDDIGHASSIVVSPRPYPNFAGCAVFNTSTHPWGKGPPETKSFTFHF